MQRIRWTLALLALWGGYLHAAQDPIALKPVAASLERSQQPQTVDSVFSAELSLSSDGKYVALAGASSQIEIWSTETGAKLAMLDPAPGKNLLVHAVLVGDPCIVVTGVGVQRSQILSAQSRPVAHPLELWDCRTGRRLGVIPLSGSSTSYLYQLAALPNCAMVAARYGDRILVVDPRTATLNQRLGDLFAQATASALRSIPQADKPRSEPDVTPLLATSSADDGCRIYGAQRVYSANATALFPAKIHEYDFARGTTRTLRDVTYDWPPNPQARGAVVRFAVSPAGRRAAFSIRDMNVRTNDRVDVLTIGLADNKSDRRFELARTLASAILDLAFLNDDTLLLTSTWTVESTDAQLLDARNGGLHTVCAPAFGEPNVSRGNPRALAVDAKHRLLAVALRDDVRIFHYSPAAGATWHGVRDCTDD